MINDTVRENIVTSIFVGQKIRKKKCTQLCYTLFAIIQKVNQNDMTLAEKFKPNDVYSWKHKMTILDNFHTYCAKHNIPDSLPVFALWEKVEELEEQNKLLKFQLDFAAKMVEKLGES